MVDTDLAMISRTHKWIQRGAAVALVVLLLAVLAGSSNLGGSGTNGLTDANGLNDLHEIGTASRDIYPAFARTESGVYTAVADGGLPVVTAREPNYAQTIDELVAYSSDMFVGVVESVIQTGQEGYPTPTLFFYDLTLRVTNSATESVQGNVIVELNNVQTPFVNAIWPAKGAIVLMFVVPDRLDRDAYSLVSSQGLYLIDTASSLSATVSDAVARQLEGKSLKDVVAKVRSIMSDIESGHLVIDRPTNRPIWVGPGNGSDPADEAKKYADEPGNDTIEPDVTDTGADHADR